MNDFLADLQRSAPSQRNTNNQAQLQQPQNSDGPVQFPTLQHFPTPVDQQPLFPDSFFRKGTSAKKRESSRQNAIKARARKLELIAEKKRQEQKMQNQISGNFQLEQLQQKQREQYEKLLAESQKQQKQTELVKNGEKGEKEEQEQEKQQQQQQGGGNQKKNKNKNKNKKQQRRRRHRRYEDSDDSDEDDDDDQEEESSSSEEDESGSGSDNSEDEEEDDDRNFRRKKRKGQQAKKSNKRKQSKKNTSKKRRAGNGSKDAWMQEIETLKKQKQLEKFLQFEQEQAIKQAIEQETAQLQAKIAEMQQQIQNAGSEKQARALARQQEQFWNNMMRAT